MDSATNHTTTSKKSWLTDNKRLIIVALLGVAGTWYATYTNSDQFKIQSTQEQFQMVVNNQQTQIDNLSAKLERQEEKTKALEVLYQDCNDAQTALMIDNEKLKNSLLIANSDMDDFPGYFIIKDLNSNGLYCNDAFEQDFLTPLGLSKTDYIGVNDTVIWGENAKPWRVDDVSVIVSGKPKTFPEAVDLKHLKENVLTTKYLIRVNSQPFALAVLSIKVK